jgi:hypothetical protein
VVVGAPGMPTIATRSDQFGILDSGASGFGTFGANRGTPGIWSIIGRVPDTGSTLSLMTLTLMALGLVARRFQRPAV